MRITCLIVLALAPSLGADEIHFDARELFAASQTANVCLAADRSTLVLEEGVLFEDDGPAAGFSYKPNEEKLSATTWIKKEFVIPNVQAKKATLLVGPGGTLQAVINGKPQPLRPVGKAGNYWQAYDVPTEAFRAGKNDVVLHGAGKVWIARADEFAVGSRARTKPPNRSAKSADAGKTWDYDSLGTKGDTDGEYYVRLFLDHYRPAGTLLLPVIDAANLAGHVVAAPVASIGPIRITLDGAAGKDGRISVRVRTGSTLAPSDKSWSPWEKHGAAGGTIEKPAGRFLQVAVDLATSNPLTTPELRSLRIEAAPRRTKDWTKAMRVTSAHNEKIVRTSIPFEYEPFDHPHLKTIRGQYKLDEVVKDARTEFELIAKLAAWSARQWERGHLRDIYPAWDALDILKPHADGTPVGGFCQQYNVVFLQACASFGLPGRAVSLGAGDHGVKIKSGHEVVEIWSNEHKTWVYVDGQMAWHFVDEKSSTPMSLLELRDRQLATFTGKPGPAVRLVSLAETGPRWQGFDAFPPFAELRLIPRSNFLQEKAPLPLNQGMRGWFWTGHHAWTDERYPASLLYGQRVSHERNWNWTLNQAAYTLEATETPGELTVHLDTVTPGFDTFLATIDGKDKQAVKSGFTWRLHPGKNRLEVRPRNLAGREGIASWAVVDYAVVP